MNVGFVFLHVGTLMSKQIERRRGLKTWAMD